MDSNRPTCTVAVKVDPTGVANRVAVQPSARGGGVVPVLTIVQLRVLVEHIAPALYANWSLAPPSAVDDLLTEVEGEME